VECAVCLFDRWGKARYRNEIIPFPFIPQVFTARKVNSDGRIIWLKNALRYYEMKKYHIANRAFAFDDMIFSLISINVHNYIETKIKVSHGFK